MLLWISKELRAHLRSSWCPALVYTNGHVNRHRGVHKISKWKHPNESQNVEPHQPFSLTKTFVWPLLSARPLSYLCTQYRNWCMEAQVYVAVPKYCYMDRYFLGNSPSSDAIRELSQIPPTLFFWGGGGGIKGSTWSPYSRFSRRLPLPRNKNHVLKTNAAKLISLYNGLRNRRLSGRRNCVLLFMHHWSVSEN